MIIPLLPLSWPLPASEGDLHQFDAASIRWTRLDKARDPAAPPAAFGAALAHTAGVLWLFGGTSGYGEAVGSVYEEVAAVSAGGGGI